MLIFAPFLLFFLLLCEEQHFYAMLCLAVRMIASACLQVYFMFFPKSDHRENYWLYSFVVLLSSSTAFHLDQLFALLVSRCSFFSCFLYPYTVLVFPIFLFWLQHLLIVCCSCILIQPMSVFFFFLTSVKHYSFSVAWFPTLTITFSVHSSHAFTRPFCEFIVDRFYWNFLISLSSFQNFALSLIARSTSSLYSLLAIAFLPAKPFWQKADDPTDSFHCRFISLLLLFF